MVSKEYIFLMLSFVLVFLSIVLTYYIMLKSGGLEKRELSKNDCRTFQRYIWQRATRLSLKFLLASPVIIVIALSLHFFALLLLVTIVPVLTIAEALSFPRRSNYLKAANRYQMQTIELFLMSATTAALAAVLLYLVQHADVSDKFFYWMMTIYFLAAWMAGYYTGLDGLRFDRPNAGTKERLEYLMTNMLYFLIFFPQALGAYAAWKAVQRMRWRLFYPQYAQDRFDEPDSSNI